MTRWLEQQAEVRGRRGLVRTPLTRAADDQAIDLASNDYLGLATDPRLAEAASEAIRRWGTGATSSRLVAGTTELHLELEHELARLTGMEASLVLSSGYLANLGVTTALGGPGTLIVADEHCHASLIDGFRLSRSRVETFAHNEPADAARLLAGRMPSGRMLSGRSEPRALIAVESIYSVWGDAAPLPGLLALAEEHDAMLLVDEAHSLGVSGSGTWQGHGAVAGTALAGHPNVVLTATLSKALGSQGGAVLGSALLREHLVNRARSFIFDTGLAPASAAAALAAVRIIRSEPWRPAAVHEHAASLASGLAPALARLATAVGHTAVGPAGAFQAAGAVQSIPMPSAAAALSASQAAHAAGVRVGCFRPPSVPDGISRLRLTARATLTPREIDQACATLRGILEETS
ncbi:8-amino-7-oxononanoate synthase [Arthrobacter cavernae]|uniref:8-amino-7-oxononanoate synthase n=1 Tax=Arthrobacter cavernae TaxID=2817681 RepID=A0A939HE56_9MICC|nr:8-amino-7-oxononanoate synthase [Arthrobacter cavernae]